MIKVYLSAEGDTIGSRKEVEVKDGKGITYNMDAGFMEITAENKSIIATFNIFHVIYAEECEDDRA